jgi:hypothetical protein
MVMPSLMTSLEKLCRSKLILYAGDRRADCSKVLVLEDYSCTLSFFPRSGDPQVGASRQCNLRTLDVRGGLVHHSNRGLRHASAEYRAEISDGIVVRKMSRRFRIRSTSSASLSGHGRTKLGSQKSNWPPEWLDTLPTALAPKSVSPLRRE